MTFKPDLANANINRLRWREHELVLATVVTILSIVGPAWRMLDMTSADLIRSFGWGFTQKNLGFNYVENVWIPLSAIAILLYLSYLQMNLFILPRLLQTDAPVKGSFNIKFARTGGIEMKGDSGIALKRMLIAILCTILIWLFLGGGWGIAIYYLRTYDYVQTDLTMDSQQMLLGLGLRNAFLAIFFYLLYATMREMVIKAITTNSQWGNFHTRVANTVTLGLTIYLCFFYFLHCFHILDEQGPGIFFMAVIPPLLLTFISNLYWLFPQKEQKNIFYGPVLRRLFQSNLFILFPFAAGLTLADMDTKGGFFIFMFFGWLIQTVLLMPISLLLYRSRKDKILRFKGMEMELDQSRADLQFLRNQINPHFLFNTLNTLYGTALQENAFRSAEGIQKLGDMMRFMLHENNQEKIPMYKELEYLQNYIDLQKLRTLSSPAIHIHADIEESPCPHMIAPMLLIPFVENAFKHGISLQERSWVEIKLECTTKGINFEVRNSVHQHLEDENEKEKSGIGMKNVLNRLRLIYAEKHEFFINSNEKEFFIGLQIQLAN